MQPKPEISFINHSTLILDVNVLPFHLAWAGEREYDWLVPRPVPYNFFFLNVPITFLFNL